MPVVGVPDDPTPGVPAPTRLTTPTVGQYAIFAHRNDLSAEDEGWIEKALADATLLMAIATELVTDPIDPNMFRLVQNGIMDMAQFLDVQRDNAEESYTPFSGERIGSYSYQLRATGRYALTLSQSGRNAPSGVFWFDLAVDKLQIKTQVLTRSENVMPTSPEPETFVDQWVWTSLPDSFGR